MPHLSVCRPRYRHDHDQRPLLPTFTGGRFSLDEIREKVNQGNACPLVKGTGRQYGLWVVTQVEETSTHFFREAAAEKIEFNLMLEHVDDKRTVLIGRLTLPAVARLAEGGRGAYERLPEAQLPHHAGWNRYHPAHQWPADQFDPRRPLGGYARPAPLQFPKLWPRFLPPSLL